MESLIRLGCAVDVFLLMISWEFLNPRRKLELPRKKRWTLNLGLAALNMLMMRLTVGGIAYLTAISTKEHGVGLLNQFENPNWLNVALTLLCLDFAIYAQHVLAHKWTFLWRFHQVHHTDTEMDATTAVRFHPFEIAFSMAYKLFFIALIGANPLAVIAFEITLNASATFNHSNVNMPNSLEKMIRYVFVTPDMHRIHHSIIPKETDSNYGFLLSCWDRFCRTYTAKPQHLQTEMAIGLANFRNVDELHFSRLLSLPFQPLKNRFL